MHNYKEHFVVGTKTCNERQAQRGDTRVKIDNVIPVRGRVCEYEKGEGMASGLGRMKVREGEETGRKEIRKYTDWREGRDGEARKS